jgi:hypothetical protein
MRNGRWRALRAASELAADGACGEGVLDHPLAGGLDHPLAGGGGGGAGTGGAGGAPIGAAGCCDASSPGTGGSVVAMMHPPFCGPAGEP